MAEHCDLVMKGGITSGVVYPKLIARLAAEYEFKNIGGTSAGAIAAGACAAAEYGRHNGYPLAFKQLEELPELLGKPSKDGSSKLFRLFQPAKSLREHFAVFVRLLNRKPLDATVEVLKGLGAMYKVGLSVGLLLGSLLICPFIAALHASIGAVATFGTALGMMLMVAGFTTFIIYRALNGQTRHILLWLIAAWGLMAVVLMAVTGQGPGWRLFGSILTMTVTALLFLSFLLVTVVLLFTRGLLTGLHGNNYGVCSGKSAEGNADPATEGLTEWMTGYFNTLAGLAPDGPPLTFGQLWGDNPEQRLINLEMMTTAVSQHMVYGLPFRPGIPPFYYDPDEWAKLFPSHVMSHLNQLDTDPDKDNDNALQVISAQGKPLRLFARPADLPIVVAVRMSLSFPLLLSAVPLYAIDWSLTETAESKDKQRPIVAKRVWFSDGGIGSNMPLHMFDSLLPDHPTFAINLKPIHPSHKIKVPETKENEGGRIYLPTGNLGGRQRFWETPDDKTPLGGLAGFFISLVNTMQSWRDELMFPYPGFRDRIIQISLSAQEGGLNLNMPETSIQALGNAGSMAADRLIESFHPAGGNGGKGWQAHRRTRLKTFLGVMQPAFASIAPTLARGEWNMPLGDYNQAQCQLAEKFLAGVQQLGQLGTTQSAGFQKQAPKPMPQVKISPRI